MIVILISEIKTHPKVPEIEQMLSTAAAAENILLALNALNYAGMWRTGVFALNEKISKYLELEENQKVIGYLYVCLLYTSPSPRDRTTSRMPSSA